MKRIGVFVCAVLFNGCAFSDEVAKDGTAFGTGAAVGALTANPVLGVAIGLLTRWATSETIDGASRHIQGYEQMRIAEAAGDAPMQTWRPWVSDIAEPFKVEMGQVMVLREYSVDPACRDIIFYENEEDRRYYTATICRGIDKSWQWASAEPAVNRWGDLQ